MKKMILIDFDGTIADSFDVIFAAMSDFFCIKKINSNTFTKDYFRNINIHDLLAQSQFKHEDIKELVKYVQSEQIKKANIIPVFDGMIDFFKFCQTENIEITIVTSSHKSLVESYCHHHGIKEYLQGIKNAGLFDKDTVILECKLQLPDYHFIYIGDETRDIEAAKKAQIASIACSWGYNSEQLLNSVSPDLIVSNPQQLATAVHALFTKLEN